MKSELNVLKLLVGICLRDLHPASTSEIAGLTDLSVSTVRRLENQQYTCKMQVWTLMKLARATGRELVVSDTYKMKRVG